MTQLTTDLSTARNKVTELGDQIGSASDPGSLQGMLAVANTKVMTA